MDHEELINELPFVEQLTVIERITLAKKRRKKQKKEYRKWSQSQFNCENEKKRKVTFLPEIQLIEAVTQGNIKELRQILEAGVDPNVPSFDGLTALHHSCIDGNSDIVNLLLLKGANVNATDFDDWTPLHAASTCGHKEVVELLVRTGGDLLAMNLDGDMPYQITDDEDTLYFLEREMSIQGITEETTKRLREAPQSFFKRDIQDAINRGDSLNYPVTMDGGSFLHVAISNFYNDQVKMLLENGASDTVEDNDGWRPVHVAAYWENKTAFDLIVNKMNTDLTVRTFAGERPHELCDDSSLKIYIIRLMNHHMNDHVIEPSNKIRIREIMNEKYFTPYSAEYLNDESNDDSSTDRYLNDDSSTDRYLNDDSSTDRYSKCEDITDLDPPDSKVKANLLYNPDANECASNIKSAIKEAKKHAPLIRSQSIERLQSYEEDLGIDNKKDNSLANNVDCNEGLSNNNVVKRVSDNNDLNSSWYENDSNSSSFISASGSTSSNMSVIHAIVEENKTNICVATSSSNIGYSHMEEGSTTSYSESDSRDQIIENMNNKIANIKNSEHLKQSSANDKNAICIKQQELNQNTLVGIMTSPNNYPIGHENIEEDIIIDIAYSILNPKDIKTIAKQIETTNLSDIKDVEYETSKTKSQDHDIMTVTDLVPGKSNFDKSSIPLLVTEVSEREQINTNALELRKTNSSQIEADELNEVSNKEDNHMKTLSQDSLYTLKWQRMMEREKILKIRTMSRESDSNTNINKVRTASFPTKPGLYKYQVPQMKDSTISIKSNNTPEYKYHFKQEEYNNKIESTLFTKSRRCTVM